MQLASSVRQGLQGRRTAFHQITRLRLTRVAAIDRRQGGAIWEDRFAAVATGKRASGFTASGPTASKRGAERSALAGCQEKGGDDCKIVMSYVNSCAAIVWGLQHRTGAYGPTVEDAVEQATQRCAQMTEDCQVFFSACSLPERVR